MSDWQIITGNCLEVMAAMEPKTIDVMIGDPPYSPYTHENHRIGAAASKGKIGEAKDLGFDALTDDLRIGLSDEAARLVRRWSLFFCDVEGRQAWQDDLGIVPEELEYLRTLLWVKTNATPQQSGDRPAHGFECMVLGHPPGQKRWNGGGKQGVYTHAIERATAEAPRLHTTQKPLGLMLDLVQDLSEPGEVILDPCCGSGTTGAAALQLGRRFIGIEEDTERAEVARKRLSEVVIDPVVFGHKAKQGRLI